MAGPFTAYFESEHRRAMRLLARCRSTGGELLLERFDEFRRTLLQRIAVEEKVFFPALVERLGHVPRYRRALTRDHADLVALCAPTPQKEWVDGLGEQLEYHHAVELGPEGFCLECDGLLGEQASAVIRRAAALEPVDVPPYTDGPALRGCISRLLVSVGVSL